MKRKIIKVNEDLCNGCGECVPDCPEGALQIIDGKVRLVSDLFCDGLGACINACPTGAMIIEEREAEPYDESKVMANISKAGINTIKAHLAHLKEHGEDKLFAEALDYLKSNNIAVPAIDDKLACGCPGSLVRNIKKDKIGATQSVETESELGNWPIQLRLVNPHAKYFSEADIVVVADCAPFAFPNFHARFLKDKSLIILCPKLDHDIESYVEKLAIIFSENNIKSTTIIHMEVPCCGGIEMIVLEAVKRANKNIVIKDYTISINGEII